jgi:hypothetical protein
LGSFRKSAISSSIASGVPIGATVTGPNPWPSRWARSGAVNVTEKSARATAPAARPVSASMPEGRSTATTRASGKPVLISAIAAA